MGSSNLHLLLLTSLLLLLPHPSLSQGGGSPSPPSPVTAPAPAPAMDCNGVQLSYNLESTEKIRPFLKDPKAQPYAFKATATVLNSGVTTLKSWALVVSFAHSEILVSISNAVLTDGSDLPYNTTVDSSTSFSGYPTTDLLTPIATAGDLTRIQAEIPIVGTLFGKTNTSMPLPTDLSLADPSFICPTPTLPSKLSTTLSTCCVPNPSFKSNTSLIPNNTDPSKSYLPRRSGDLTITYDVLQAYSSSYLALVTMENNNRLGRLDNWQLSWEWKRQEFIYSMKGAYPLDVDTNGCVYGPQGNYYKELDFSKVLNCQSKPVILDLPLSRYNDTVLGKIPYCCRNGTILPKAMDPSQSISSFQMQVFKMPPDMNRTDLYPPANWKIKGGSSLNPEYVCGQPARVSPTEFPDPSGLESTTSVVATWQIICNITTAKNSKPKCCVSFSAYYNESVIPCKTCACGCPANRPGPTCSTTAPALLVPSQALLVPFDNRTSETLAWAELKHFNVPNPMPCGDYCGVSINWHLNADYSKGWTARVTFFNWEGVDLANWFAAVVMDKAYAGFEAAYSFNGSAVGNDTIFMQGLEGLNYLVKQTPEGVPGKQQSVISFTKKTTPGIDVVAGDGFPTKIYFNGDECSMPGRIPMSHSFRTSASGVFTLVMLVVTSALLMFEL
ncbi:COBRA-like protein 7 [Typha angustifolia]|uniref:COBRA-like protein 7 n=1 Tax=Typha angustifolia TaxID=59011 RepID=UPI003C2CE29B